MADNEAYSWVLGLPVDAVNEAVPESVRELIDVVGLEAALRLLVHYQGQQLYLVKLDTAFRRLRDERIRAEADGVNYRALARKYGLSEGYIYELLRRPQQQFQQESLFE